MPVVSSMAVVACTQACVLLLICLSEAVSTATRNYYETINVEPTATDRQIKKAFHKLALKFHPDKNGSADAEKTFREIAEGKNIFSFYSAGLSCFNRCSLMQKLVM